MREAAQNMQNRGGKHQRYMEKKYTVNKTKAVSYVSLRSARTSVHETPKKKV